MKRGLKKSSDINKILHPRNLMKLKKPAPLFLVSRSPKTNITMEKNKNNHLKMYFLFNSDDFTMASLLVLPARFYRKNPVKRAWKKTAQKKTGESCSFALTLTGELFGSEKKLEWEKWNLQRSARDPVDFMVGDLVNLMVK